MGHGSSQERREATPPPKPPATETVHGAFVRSEPDPLPPGSQPGSITSLLGSPSYQPPGMHFPFKALASASGSANIMHVDDVKAERRRRKEERRHRSTDFTLASPPARGGPQGGVVVASGVAGVRGGGDGVSGGSGGAPAPMVPHPPLTTLPGNAATSALLQNFRPPPAAVAVPSTVDSSTTVLVESTEGGRTPTHGFATQTHPDVPRGRNIGMAHSSALLPPPPGPGRPPSAPPPPGPSPQSPPPHSPPQRMLAPLSEAEHRPSRSSLGGGSSRGVLSEALRASGISGPHSLGLAPSGPGPVAPVAPTAASSAAPSTTTLNPVMPTTQSGGGKLSAAEPARVPHAPGRGNSSLSMYGGSGHGSRPRAKRWYEKEEEERLGIVANEPPAVATVCTHGIVPAGIVCLECQLAAGGEPNLLLADDDDDGEEDDGSAAVTSAAPQPRASPMARLGATPTPPPPETALSFSDSDSGAVTSGKEDAPKQESAAKATTAAETTLSIDSGASDADGHAVAGVDSGRHPLPPRGNARAVAVDDDDEASPPQPNLSRDASGDASAPVAWVSTSERSPGLSEQLRPPPPQLQTQAVERSLGDGVFATPHSYHPFLLAAGSAGSALPQTPLSMVRGSEAAGPKESWRLMTATEDDGTTGGGTATADSQLRVPTDAVVIRASAAEDHHLDQHSHEAHGGDGGDDSTLQQPHSIPRTNTQRGSYQEGHSADLQQGSAPSDAPPMFTPEEPRSRHDSSGAAVGQNRGSLQGQSHQATTSVDSSAVLQQVVRNASPQHHWLQSALESQNSVAGVAAAAARRRSSLRASPRGSVMDPRKNSSRNSSQHPGIHQGNHRGQSHQKGSSPMTTDEPFYPSPPAYARLREETALAEVTANPVHEHRVSGGADLPVATAEVPVTGNPLLPSALDAHSPRGEGREPRRRESSSRRRSSRHRRRRNTSGIVGCLLCCGCSVAGSDDGRSVIPERGRSTMSDDSPTWRPRASDVPDHRWGAARIGSPDAAPALNPRLGSDERDRLGDGAPHAPPSFVHSQSLPASHTAHSISGSRAAHALMTETSVTDTIFFASQVLPPGLATAIGTDVLRSSIQPHPEERSGAPGQGQSQGQSQGQGQGQGAAPPAPTPPSMPPRSPLMQHRSPSNSRRVVTAAVIPDDSSPSAAHSDQTKPRRPSDQNGGDQHASPPVDFRDDRLSFSSSRGEASVRSSRSLVRRSGDVLKSSRTPSRAPSHDPSRDHTHDERWSWAVSGPDTQPSDNATGGPRDAPSVTVEQIDAAFRVLITAAGFVPHPPQGPPAASSSHPVAQSHHHPSPHDAHGRRADDAGNALRVPDEALGVLVVEENVVERSGGSMHGTGSLCGHIAGKGSASQRSSLPDDDGGPPDAAWDNAPTIPLTEKAMLLQNLADVARRRARNGYALPGLSEQRGRGEPDNDKMRSIQEWIWACR